MQFNLLLRISFCLLLLLLLGACSTQKRTAIEIMREKQKIQKEQEARQRESERKQLEAEKRWRSLKEEINTQRNSRTQTQKFIILNKDELGKSKNKKGSVKF